MPILRRRVTGAKLDRMRRVPQVRAKVRCDAGAGRRRRMTKTHYMGPLSWQRGRVRTQCSGPFPVCCSGERAYNVNADGNQTRVRNLVTCKRCLRCLTLAAQAQAPKEEER